MKTQDKQQKGMEIELKQLGELQSQNKLKTCLLTFIIYTQESKRTEYFKGFIRMIMEKFPCRAIFIQGEPAAHESYLRVQVCNDVSTTQGMSCDQIVIETGGEASSRVPFLILPHLIPDLPVYLLWGQDPTTESTILPHLQQFAKRLIFDSECTNNLQKFSQTMLTRLETTNIDIMDINWARMGGWRHVISQVFDSQQRIQQLASARLIKIVYNSRPHPLFSHPETQSFYLQAWLASQLGWKFEKLERSDKEVLLHYSYDQHSVRVNLQPEGRENLPTEEILEIEVSDQEHYVYSLLRQSDNQVIVHYSTQDQCELPFALFLPHIRSARNIMQEIVYQKPSEQYVRMLRLISYIQGT